MDYSWAKVDVQCVCIDDQERHERYSPNYNYVSGLDGLTKNKIYTIKEMYIDSEDKVLCATLKEIHRGFDEVILREAGFNINRFRPLSEIRKEKFKQMINNIPSSFYNEVVKESERV